MVNEDVLETELAFNRLKKISRGIRFFLIMLACFVAILLVVKLWAALFGTPEDQLSGGLLQNITAVGYIVVSDAIVMVCLLIGANVFSALGKGIDPFSKRQVRIIRIAALLLIIDVVINALGAVGLPWFAQLGPASIGMTQSHGGRLMIPINAGELVIAGILFGFSVVVDYARLLQKLSDETL